MVEEADLEERERAPAFLTSPEEGEARVRSLLDKGQREAAVDLLKKLVGKFPKANRCRRQLAMILARSGSFDRDVERHFVIALEAEPDDVELRHSLATYYRRSGMGARAMLQLRQVLSTDPGHAGAWRDLGELEAGEGRRGR
jgi:Flp pilus assembly protein TadD